MDSWQQIWQTVVSEFSDIPDVAEATRVTIRLTLASLLGGVLGYERERKGKSAGLRTHMLVALGASLFVLLPIQAGASISDVSRVLQGLVTGIGFLGAGAIIKVVERENAKGLTTAAGIWMTAAIGVAVGMGHETMAILSTFIALIILSVIVRFEQAISQDSKDTDVTPADTSTKSD